MALGTNHVTKTTADKFIPEIWSDEIIAAYKKNLVAANLFSKMAFKGKKGDTLHIPKPTRGNASLKSAESQVTLIAATETEVQVLINKHYEYSRLIEDIVEVQALASLRKFYTDDAGYALGKQVDTDLLKLGRLLNSGSWNGTDATFTYANAFLASDGTTAFDPTASTNTGNEAAIADAGIRRSIQRLDDNDVPMTDRFLVIPPSTRNELMGLDRFTEQAFVGEVGGQNTIRNGQIGDIYGVKVFVSTNCDTATTAGAGDVNPRIALLAQKDAFVLVEQMGVRTQTQYKQEYLGTLFTSDMLYGVKEIRAENAVALAVLG
jgi:N4-gp56 family major capsid protein